jgi:hypothetical protein
MNALGGLVTILKTCRRSSGWLVVMVWMCMVGAVLGTRAAESPWPDMSGDWAMVQVLVARADLPVVGSIRIDTIVGALTHITQSGSSLILQDRYCFTDAQPSTLLFRTDIADAVMQSIEPKARTALLSWEDCDLRLSQDWYTEIRGAVLEDPEHDPLPDEPNDVRLVDLEGDGNPGMTIQASILGLFTGEGYAVQRYRYRLDGTIVDANTIIGFIDWTSEQNVLAATHPLFMESFSDDTDSDPRKHRFLMIRADEACTCETLHERLPELLNLLDF